MSQTYVFTVAVTGGEGPDVQDGMDTPALAEMVRNEVIAFCGDQEANRSEPLRYSVVTTPPVRVA